MFFCLQDFLLFVCLFAFVGENYKIWIWLIQFVLLSRSMYVPVYLEQHCTGSMPLLSVLLHSCLWSSSVAESQSSTLLLRRMPCSMEKSYLVPLDWAFRSVFFVASSSCWFLLKQLEKSARTIIPQKSSNMTENICSHTVTVWVTDPLNFPGIYKLIMSFLLLPSLKHNQWQCYIHLATSLSPWEPFLRMVVTWFVVVTKLFF